MMIGRIMMLLLLLTVVPSGAAFAQRIRMSYAGTTGFNVPFWVTHEAGLYKKQGLTAELILISGGATNIQALLAGDLQFVNAAGPAPINAILRGADIVIIASYYNFMPYGLVAGKDIRSAQDLKGKQIAVSRLGGITEVAVQMAFEKLGLAVKETTLVQAGPDASRIAAVHSGAAAATVLVPPGLFAATSLGLRMLADLGDLGLRYPTAVIVTRRSLIAQNRPLVKRFLMAFVEGLHLYKQKKKFSTDIMQQYTKLSDQELLSKTHDYFAKNTSLAPLSDSATLKIALPAGKFETIELYDNSVLHELINEGFIEKAAREVR